MMAVYGEFPENWQALISGHRLLSLVPPRAADAYDDCRDKP
jgi:hypothetical protein